MSEVNRKLKSEIASLKEHLNFYGIQILEDGSTMFKPSIMNKFRKMQRDVEFVALQAENSRLAAESERLRGVLEKAIFIKLEGGREFVKDRFGWSPRLNGYLLFTNNAKDKIGFLEDFDRDFQQARFETLLEAYEALEGGEK